LRDANADTLKAIIDQIRAAPDKATRVLEQQNAQAEQLQKTMVKTMGLDDPEGEGDAPAS
jgi:hypothetical protein